MRIFSAKQFVDKLKEEGIYFSSFSLTSEGNYSADDADWNYKDVPHLHHVHELAEAIPAVIGDDIIATINTQKFLGMKVPLALFNYQSAPNAQTYYTTWFFFTLVIETQYDEIAPNRTQVITTYHIGSPKYLRWCFPLIAWTLKRNYKNLMSTDIPMRERRGQLRSWGYTFHRDKPKYSFQETLNIVRSNVISPKNIDSTVEIKINIKEKLPKDGEYFYGRDDHMGLRLIRKDNELLIYPRSCPHEGASLDNQKCEDKKIKCPWHGRVFNPIAQFDLEKSTEQGITIQDKRFILDDGVLSVTLSQCVTA